MDWLNLRDKEPAIYKIFGSYFEISSQLMEEIGLVLLKCGSHFCGYKDELEKQGKIVSWFSQVEVLKRPSVDCFLTHYE
ncbi:hypothetical protein H5410_050170 [Solanum commersonii]|uniref:Uncharacterized protein n=1 Tax=Solanum commersonii TaxID=4109 RepID=A0A9J5WW26_SOLCO|nr:hypothetical protein H5410_050170 [Solanum commersonii]